jgi:hypothetical protein
MIDADTYAHADIPVRIVYDDEPLNPREECEENFTTIVAWHRRSDLGDKGFNYRDLPSFDTPEEVEAWLREEHGAICVMPLYLYEHSGQTLSLRPFGDPWDSGQVGFVFVTQAHMDATGAPTPEGLIEGDVATYDAFLRGEVYGYIVADDEDDAESCWGFYDQDECKQQANDVAESIATRRAEEAAEAAYWLAREVVTV